MANRLLDLDGLNWVDGKFKIHVCDRLTYGDAARITNTTPTISNIGADGAADVTFTTLAAHGLSVGSIVSIRGMSTVFTPFATSTAYSLGDWVLAGGFVHRVVRAGTSSGTAPTTWSVVKGGHTLSNNVLFKAMYTDELWNPMNGIWIVKAIPTTTTFTVRGYNPRGLWTWSASRFMRISARPFMSDWLSASVKGTTAALEGKSVKRGMLSAWDTTVDTATFDTATGFFLLVRTANLHADTDLATTAQKVIAFWDDSDGLTTGNFVGDGTLILKNFIQI